MTWIGRHRLVHYLNESVWILPCAGIVAGILAGRMTVWTDYAAGWTSSLHPDSARTVLITLASSMFTFVVFVGSALLIALQLASAQLTPRIIALVYRDYFTKAAMTLFMFTFTLSVTVVMQMNDTVPLTSVKLAEWCCVLSLAVFLYLVDHIGRSLRPATMLRRVALAGRRVIESVFPTAYTEDRQGGAQERGTLGTQSCSITSTRDGVILAFDIEGIVSLAQRGDGVLEMVPQVGDFVAKGEPLINVYGDGLRVETGSLLGMIAIGAERSMEQDPMFAFRIMVDIACKALSPAINDPTTAVLAIDQIHHLLRRVGTRHLDDERIWDSTGRLRMIHRTPGWEDFVHLAVTEIRQYGCESVQVHRRLRGMLQSLIKILPPPRAQVLQAELDLLTRTAQRCFEEREDQAMASMSDSQGMGGSADDAARAAACDREPHHPAKERL